VRGKKGERDAIDRLGFGHTKGGCVNKPMFWSLEHFNYTPGDFFVFVLSTELQMCPVGK
jgi:hypothetical protein